LILLALDYTSASPAKRQPLQNQSQRRRARAPAPRM